MCQRVRGAHGVGISSSRDRYSNLKTTQIHDRSECYQIPLRTIAQGRSNLGCERESFRISGVYRDGKPDARIFSKLSTYLRLLRRSKGSPSHQSLELDARELFSLSNLVRLCRLLFG